MANNDRYQYNQDWDRNRRRYDRGNDYDRQDYDQNRNRWNDYGNSGYSGAASYNQYGWQNDRNDDPYYRDMDSYGNDYGRNLNTSAGWNNRREDYNSRWRNTGRNYDDSYSTGSYGERVVRRDNEDRNRGNRDWWDRSRDEVSSWFGNEDAQHRRETDKQLAGMYRGKGPKGYTRSDDRIREDVQDRLADDPYVDASDIEVKVEHGVVVLTGDIADREQKRRAEDIIEAVSGVRDVENRLHVMQHHDHYADAGHKQADFRNYTGTTDDVSGIGHESGTTNEMIRNAGNMNTNR